MTLVEAKRRKKLLPDLWEDFFNDRFFNAPFLSMNRSDLSVVPDANIIENPDNFQIELAAPGLEKKDFKVEMQNGSLSISAEKEEEKKEENKNFRRREFSFSSFTRSFTLPENILKDKIDAKYESGVLKLTIPKKEVSPAEPVKEIKVG